MTYEEFIDDIEGIDEKSSIILEEYFSRGTLISLEIMENINRRSFVKNFISHSSRKGVKTNIFYLMNRGNVTGDPLKFDRCYHTSISGFSNIKKDTIFIAGDITDYIDRCFFENDLNILFLDLSISNYQCMIAVFDGIAQVDYRIKFILWGHE